MMRKIETKTKGWIWVFVLLLALLLLVVGSLSLGATPIPLQDTLQWLCGRGDSLSSATYHILQYVRLTRTLAALLAGASLAVSGALLQTVLGNHMASPSVIGVNAGASFGGAISLLLFPGNLRVFPLATFLGALLTALLVYAIAARTGASRVTLVLTGLAIGSILSAATSGIHTIQPDILVGSNSFRVGGFSFTTPEQLRFAAPYLLVGLALALLLSQELSLLTLGDELAWSLGLSVRVYRFLSLALAALLAGAAVSFAGLLGFVGLLVPHITRLWTKRYPSLYLPCTLLGGAFFVLLCDTLTRFVFAPYEFPVGIVMSFLGGPFFLWLLFSQRRTRHA